MNSKHRTNGDRSDVVPLTGRALIKAMRDRSVSFAEAAKLLRKRDDASAFHRAAEICLAHHKVLAKEPGGSTFAVLKLVIDLHKHGLFCEVAQDKTRTEHDARAYDLFQKYLAGETSTPVAVGLPIGGTEPAATVDVDAENGDDHGEEEQAE